MAEEASAKPCAWIQTQCCDTERHLRKCVDLDWYSLTRHVTLTGPFLSRDLPHPINEDFIGLLGWLDDSGPMLPTVLAQS